MTSLSKSLLVITCFNVLDLEFLLAWKLRRITSIDSQTSVIETEQKQERGREIFYPLVYYPEGQIGHESLDSGVSRWVAGTQALRISSTALHMQFKAAGLEVE